MHVDFAIAWGIQVDFAPSGVRVRCPRPNVMRADPGGHTTGSPGSAYVGPSVRHTHTGFSLRMEPSHGTLFRPSYRCQQPMV